ncbi:SDR family NAD(P)-dependent oxidoreductase [Vibrio taketomensis]|uniref:SDR family NAD(P)-dependent oxidoreductase n=1 Tax=Vibrio taketomensis TaxID=2572923 RepID=UPI00138A0B11|nr:SDR family NAD(P)-dependent oxidoreductase [Vibrio taketomensis]
MQKVILVTGATDGIGFETAKMLVEQNHHLIVHGRSAAKVEDVVNKLQALHGNAKVESVVADLSNLKAVTAMVTEIAERFGKIDVLINNAGVYSTPHTITDDGLDVRFVVNTIAPYYLTKELLPLLSSSGRVVNLSSAAQAPVNIDALEGHRTLGDGDAYAQSKLALTMWSRALGLANQHNGPMIVSVNPKSFLGSKMVKDAYGIAGGDLSQGADILVRAGLSDEFNHAHGKYYDNDIEAFAQPHSQALDDAKVAEVIASIKSLITRLA